VVERKEIVVNALHGEYRVALVENGALAELYVERPSAGTLVGSIFKGKVSRVLAGMDAAFVNIGLEKAGFLYVSDVVAPAALEDLELEGEGEEKGDVPPGNGRQTAGIRDVLQAGQELLVQVAKAPIGTKGARLSTHIALPGRLLVCLPTVEHIGVSRRIRDEAERERLRALIMKIRPAGMGFIARTAAEGANEEALTADMAFLVRLWDDIRTRAKNCPPETKIYQELDLITRSTRDLFTDDVDRLVIDDGEIYRRLVEFVRIFMPQLAERVELYTGREPIFDAFGLETEIARALERKVWLKSGGYIVIDQTEALCTIDVNTGRYVGRYNLEDTITRINLEAVKEIVCQLRLRDIGGIIIIDFIDMEKASNRDKVTAALQAELTRDRARSTILKISELGLVEMTRKRVSESLTQRLTEVCSCCEGLGRVKSLPTLASEILRAIEREAREGQTVRVMAHRAVCDWLVLEENHTLAALEKRCAVRILLDPREDLPREQYQIRNSSG